MKKNAVSTLLILATVMAMISSGASVWPAAGECRGPMQLYSAGSIGACSALGGALFPAGELNACQNSSAMFPTAELKACAESGPLFPSLALNACYGPLSLTAEASQLQACYKTEPMFLAQAMSGCSGPNRLFATSALTDCSGPHALSFTTQSPALTACSGPYRLFEAPIESACYGPVILNLPSAPAKPSNTLPAPGEQNVPLGPGLQASPFSDPDGIVTQAAAQWQVRMTTSSADYSVVVFDSGADAANLSGIIVPAGCLVNDTMYSWHVRYQGASNLWSPWSDETSFTTVRRTTPVAPNQPLNTLPQDQAINVSLTPALQSSPFSDANGDAHAASQWQIRVAAAAPDYSTTVFDTGETSANLTTCLVSVGYLNYDTSYFWRVRHRDSSSADVDGRGLWSAWSQETEFRTLANGANHAPNQPVNLEPIADQTGISTAPLLRASAFGDQDSGDFQTASEWRIRSAAGDYAAPVYDSGVLFGAVSEHWIAPGRLLGNTVYYWQVRYRDSRDSWSAWSLETSFHTALHGELEAPQGLRAVAGARSVWLTWILNDNCRVIGYNVYRADSASLPLLKITVAPVRGNEYLDQNLTPHQTYYYCISAVAASGAESAMTAPVEALVGATRVFMTNLRGLPGQKAQGWVTIDNPNDIANEAMLVEIKYDPALLSPSGVQTTPLSAAFHIDWNRGVSDGLLRTVGLGSGVKLVGEGHVLQTTWQISSSAPLWTRSELNFGDVELYYLRNSDSGTTIAQIGVDATLSATLTIGQPILLGDVTLDGKVNPADLVWLREIILGHVIPMEEQKEAGDLNGDKLLDSADTVLLWHLILYGNCNPTPAMAARKALGLGAAAHNLSWDLQTNLGPTRLAVPLMLDEREGIAGMDVVVNFDPSRLQLVSIERGPDCDFDILTNNVVNGQARLLFDVRNDVTAGGGARMATLVFEALGMWERTMLYTVKFKASGADGVNLMRTRSIAVSDAQIAYPASSQIAVQGLITDRLTNAPVAGAEVAIEGATSQTMTTGADGRYQAQIMALPGSSVLVRAAKNGYETATASAPMDTTVTLNLALWPLMTLAGTVQDAATLAALEGVEVSAAGVTTGGAVTGADGRYQFAVKAPHDGSSVKLKARKAGYEVYRATLAAYAPAPAEILMTPVADWQLYYTVIYKGRGKKQIDAQGVVITGGGAKDTLLIKRNKGRTGKAVIMRVATDSSFARVYTEAPIARLEVTSGALKSLTAVGANVERILAGEIGTVRMTGAAIGDDGVTSAPAYAFTGIVAVSSSPLSANGRFLKPKIQTSAITIEGVALARQKARATISAGAKKLRAPDKKSWYVGYGGVSALLAGERHLRDMFMALDEQPDDLTLNIEARELASLSVTGGAIEGGDVEAQGVASVTAGGTAFTFKRAGGAKYGVFRQGNIAPRMISSGPLGKLLTVTAKGGDVRVGDPAQLTGSVAAGGVFSGGAVASVSAKLGGIRSPQGGVVAGGVVGFAPVVPAPADAGTSAPARWTWIESGVKDQSAGALHPDILSISGDVGVFGVFVAADDRTTTIPHPQASVRSIKTLKTAPGWAAGAQQTWWFSVAGEAYSLDPVKPDTKNSEGFRDELH